MFPLHTTILCAICWLADPGSARVEGSYLYFPATSFDGKPSARVEPYVPHEGDLVLFNDHKLMWQILYRVALTEPPDHSGIVVLRPDGTPALLESGPDDGEYVCILDALPRLRNFQGTIWIRRCKRRLTKEQSAKLTQFALAQEGKRYAVWRLLLQGTPFRSRGWLQSKYFAKTYLDRGRWLCSELVVAAGTIAGLFDPEIHKANAMYPRDIIDNHVYDLSVTWDDPGIWSSCQPVAPSR
jgi:hypothetical protein